MDDTSKTTPAKTAHRILAEAGQRPTRLPRLDVEAVAELARAYLAFEAGRAGATLGEAGQVYVSLAAVEAYANHEQLANEQARRELAELLLEGRLLVVTHVSVRDANVGGRRG